MSLSSTIGSYAANNPAVAAAVTQQSTNSALLYQMESGDPSSSDPTTSSLLGALYNEQTESSTLFNSASDPFLGQNLDIQA